MTETGRNEIVWRPTPEYVERARITRLMRATGVATLAELRRRSVEDPEWYWRAVEQVAAEAAVILFFEDLQWSDGSTLELMAYLAQLQEQARLLVIGTYRDADMNVTRGLAKTLEDSLRSI